MNILRPTKLNEVIGNDIIKERISISIKAANIKNRPLRHVLLLGSKGLGKTTLAFVIANELGSDILVGNGGSISSLKDIVPYLIRLKHRDILFIDEIHRIRKNTQEILYTAVEDFYITPGRGSNKISLQPFTMIGATTAEGMLLPPFLDRFVYQYQLNPYTNTELSLIIQQSANKLALNLSKEAIVNLANRCRGTPRIANNYLLWIKDYVISHGLTYVDNQKINLIMGVMNVDSSGMTSNDKRYLQALQNGPLGISNLTSILNLSRETVEQVIEPFLISQGLVQITSRGRILI